MAGLSSRALATSPENRLHYNGKEEQRREFSDGSGMEWLDYGARMYDAQVGRFFGVDMMTEKTIHFSPYSYAANQPVNLIDIMGLTPGNGDQQKENPGDPYPMRFKTEAAAAFWWMAQYNIASVKDKHEFASFIYRYTDKDGVWYKYTKPVSGQSSHSLKHDEIDKIMVPAGAVKVAFIHSHSEFDGKHATNMLSQADMRLQTHLGMNLYATSPEGSLIFRKEASYSDQNPEPQWLIRGFQADPGIRPSDVAPFTINPMFNNLDNKMPYLDYQRPKLPPTRLLPSKIDGRYENRFFDERKKEK